MSITIFADSFTVVQQRDPKDPLHPHQRWFATVNEPLFQQRRVFSELRRNVPAWVVDEVMELPESRQYTFITLVYDPQHTKYGYGWLKVQVALHQVRKMSEPASLPPPEPEYGRRLWC